ncbi:restriction endonuclease subunit S [Janibacter anophelis]|uniref:restriction endonuclease subunit S n=1 Tax=Janibacter anophelis TaxID=319054 RepID=UPI0013B0599C|nr:restriction endonuclease subunit S [Janibacter anophelis]
MAELDAASAIARPREALSYSEVGKGYTVFRDGDLLLAKITPCWENGKIGQAALDHEVGVGSTEFHVVRPGAQVDARYLMRFLRTEDVRATGELRMTGSGGQRRVPVKYLQDLEVPLPHPDEQRRIAAILDHADTLRTKRRQVLAHLDDLTQSIFHDMFGDWEPEATVGDVAEIQGGLQVSRKRANLPIEVPYLRVANAFRGRLDLTEVKNLKATDAELCRTRLVAGDLLFVEGHANPMEVGRVAMWNGEMELCVHQNHLIRGRLDKSRVLPEFASAWLNTPHGAEHFRRAGKTTSGLNTISAKTVRSAPIPMPPLWRQEQFVKWAESVTRVARRVDQSVASDDELFASLQSRAFRGEL